MPVRMLNFVQDPPPASSLRNKFDKILLSIEWRDTLIALEAGLAPQEYLCIDFSDEYKARFGGHYKSSKTSIVTIGFREKISHYCKRGAINVDVYVKNDKVYIVGR